MSLLSVADALDMVLQHTQRLNHEPVNLSPSILGRVLAEDIVSDIDSPPFDKSMVDGYALRSSDVSGNVLLQVVEEILAGVTPQRTIQPGEAARIMTGALIPAGADAVVMHELTTWKAETQQVLLCTPVKPRQNIMARATEMRLGDTVLGAGARLRPQDMGLLATVGRTYLQCFRTPQVAILSTGDEIVEPGEPLRTGHIRNSNASLLMGLVARAQCIPNYLGIALDSLDSLRPLVARGLQFDVLLISGGISAGKVDLVPKVLLEAGVTAVFHKVAMKPGKPLFFGTNANTLVFGLPGNPVSGMVGFELFVRPALRKLMGRATPYASPILQARCTSDFAHQADRPTYYPVQLRRLVTGWEAQPVGWKGSGDLRSICAADGFAVLPPGDVRYAAGDCMDVLWPECDH